MKEGLGRHCPRTNVFETQPSVLEHPAFQLAAQLRNGNYLAYNIPLGRACRVVRQRKWVETPVHTLGYDLFKEEVPSCYGFGEGKGNPPHLSSEPTEM